MIFNIWGKIELISQVIYFRDSLKGLLSVDTSHMQLPFLRNLSMIDKILKRNFLLSLTQESCLKLLNRRC